MINRTRRTLATTMLLTTIATTTLAPPASRAELPAQACFGGVLDLYHARRTSAALDYLACRTTCRATDDAGAACVRDCRVVRAAELRVYRTEADGHIEMCTPDAAGVQIVSVAPSCGVSLGECAADVEASARICRRNRDLTQLQGCADEVAAAADSCVATFVGCGLPSE